MSFPYPTYGHVVHIVLHVNEPYVCRDGIRPKARSKIMQLLPSCREASWVVWAWVHVEQQREQKHGQGRPESTVSANELSSNVVKRDKSENRK